MPKEVIVSWSGGKDSAFALYEIIRNGNYKVYHLLTTITEGYNRVSIHGVRQTLLEAQVKSLGLPLRKVYIPKNASNEDYEFKMEEALTEYIRQGVSSVVFADIFLEEVRKYRETNLSKIGMRGLFPLWGRNTEELAHRFIDAGFQAVITCIDSAVMNKKFVGRSFDKQLLDELPSNVDPCGEKGEFHSFVYDGPLFRKGVVYKKGGIILRDKRFYYCDLIPGQK